jgi:hypothetical protein
MANTENSKKVLLARVVDLVDATSFWLHDPEGGGNEYCIDCMSTAVSDVLEAIRDSAELSELHSWADLRHSCKVDDLTAKFAPERAA